MWESWIGPLELHGPVAAMAIPLIGGILLTLLGRWPNLREAVTLVTGGVLLTLVLSLVPIARQWGESGVNPRFEWFEVLPAVPLAFQVEPLGMLYALLASSLWILNSIYSIGYMRGHHEKHQTRFYLCFALAITSVMGIAFSANLFTLFFFYEALTLSTFPLVSHKGTPDAVRSARTYLGVLVTTSVGLLLVAVVRTYQITGTLDFQSGGVFREVLASGDVGAGTIGLLFVLFVFGIGKAALMPAHRWLPAAMVAPTPVSALLHAVAVVKAGVFSVLKVTVYVLGLDTLRDCAGPWILYASCFTILVASCVALAQDNLKRRLAYSTVSQLAYIVLGAALLQQISIEGGAIHLVMHGFGKITLFFCAGAIYVAAHKTEISDMRGLGRKMPFTFAAFGIGALSIIGLPPFGGTWGKWFLMVGAMEAEQLFVLVVLMVSSLLNIVYLLPIAVNAFFVPERGAVAALAGGGHGSHGPATSSAKHDSENGLNEAPLCCVIPLCITALACLALFVYPDPILDLAQRIGAGG